MISKADEAERCPPQLNTVEGVHRTSDSQMEVLYLGLYRSRGHTVHGTEILKQLLLPGTAQLKEQKSQS